MADKKKVIILYSTGGMGHKKAALALRKAFEDRADGADIEIIDVIEYGNKIYKFLYLDFYVFMMSRAKWLWGALYYFSNNMIVDRLTRGLRAFTDYQSLPGFGKILAEKSPDAIVATHFLLSSIAGILKKYDDLHAKLYTLITDYGPHNYWLSDDVDKFFVGADPVVAEMGERGIPPEKITVSGIPTTEEFYRELDVEELRKKYGLDAERKTIFLMSGGFGVGPIERILLSLNSCRSEIQVITVCGHNKVVYNDIRHLENELDYPLVLFGFTDKVAELMKVSDVMITKAGGISVTEALNSRLPMILHESIPGQETWNEELLVGSGAAEKAENINDIPAIVDKMLLSDDAYNAFMAGIDKLRRPNAAEKVVDVVMEEIG